MNKKKIWRKILRPTCYGNLLSKTPKERDECFLKCEYYKECLSLTVKRFDKQLSEMVKRMCETWEKLAREQKEKSGKES